MEPKSPSEFAAARAELQTWVKTHVVADQHAEVSRLIAAYVAAAVRRKVQELAVIRSVAELQQRVKDILSRTRR
jgi:hypothetical protein